MELTITHWFPILTICPVSKLPDFIFIRVTFKDFTELYAVRRALRKAFSWKRMFMEDVATAVSEMYPEAKRVEVTLIFNKHRVTVEHW